MNKNRPIKDRKVKRSPNVREQIHAAAKDRKEQMNQEVKFYQEQLNKGDERVEKLKGQIVTTKRTNNTTRVGAIAAVAAGTLASNLVFLQGGDSPTDTALKYGIALSACFGAYLMNKHFNNTDITMTEMLKRANEWSRQEFTPEEVQTFKELYDEVKKDLENHPELKKEVKSNFIYQASQGVILSLAIACLASAADKLDYGFMDYIVNRRNDESNSNTLETDASDPASSLDRRLKFSHPE